MLLLLLFFGYNTKMNQTAPDVKQEPKVQVDDSSGGNLFFIWTSEGYKKIGTVILIFFSSTGNQSPATDSPAKLARRVIIKLLDTSFRYSFLQKKKTVLVIASFRKK